MKRRPRPSIVRTAMPALATLLSQCSREPPRYAHNPPGPTHEPPPPPPPDAGVAVSLEPMRIDPNNIPPIPLAGAPMPSTYLPRPAPTPPPAPAPSPAPSAAAPSPAPAMGASAMAAPAMAAPSAQTATDAAPGLYIVHNHPPGTACRPLSQTEIRQAAQQAGITR